MVKIMLIPLSFTFQICCVSFHILSWSWGNIGKHFPGIYNYSYISSILEVHYLIYLYTISSIVTFIYKSVHCTSISWSIHQSIYLSIYPSKLGYMYNVHCTYILEYRLILERAILPPRKCRNWCKVFVTKSLEMWIWQKINTNPVI